MDKPTAKKTKATNKNLFIALGVACALLVIIIVGVLMFFRSPERQVAGGFANLINAKSIGIDGTIKSTSAAGSYDTQVHAVTNKKVVDSRLDFTYKSAQNNSMLKGKAQAVVADDGVLYAKIDQPKKFMESFANSFVAPMIAGAGLSALTPAQQQLALTPLRTSLVDAGSKMEGKWLKISQSQLRRLTGGSANSNSDCYVQFSRELQSNSGARNDLAGAYQKHQFITIDQSLEGEGSSKGYRVAIDQSKLKEFKDSVSSNQAVQKLGDCGQDILTLGASDTLNDQKVDLWIDQFTGNITRIKYDKSTPGDSDSAVDLKLSYGVAVDVATPQDAIGLDKVLPQLFAAE